MNPDGGMTMQNFIFWAVAIYLGIAIVSSYYISRYFGDNK